MFKLIKLLKAIEII